MDELLVGVGRYRFISGREGQVDTYRKVAGPKFYPGWLANGPRGWQTTAGGGYFPEAWVACRDYVAHWLERAKDDLRACSYQVTRWIKLGTLSRGTGIIFSRSLLANLESYLRAKIVVMTLQEQLEQLNG